MATLASSDLALAFSSSDFYVFGDGLFDPGNLGDSFRFTNRVGPMVGYDYINVEVDEFTEKGSSATALVVDDQKTMSSSSF